jgi:hypothetical protein
VPGGVPSPDRVDAVIGAAAPLCCFSGGAINSQTLAGMKFGRLAGSRTLFDAEAVTFE